jgi:membrane-bound lytic murein transglycosylase D
MPGRSFLWLTLVLLGLVLSGCSTTPVDYSSLPPAAQHPAKPAPAGPAVTPPPVRPVPHLPSGEYADLLDRIRAGYGLQDVPHYAVDREVNFYVSRPDYLDRIFRRGARYLHYIVEEIEKRGLPMELALLPVVESAFNPVAYSRSRASGLWQFIPSTGKHYGLEQNWWVDERRDVLKATNAALNYLAYLNRYFNGDWFLAIAAYNGGEGTVGTAVSRNAAAGKPTDFFSLNLRAETRDYVPKLLAMRRIVGNPESYGLQFAPIPNEPYFTVVDPGRQINIAEAAALAGISKDDIFSLNPAFNRMTTPPHGPHQLLLPVQSAPVFMAALNSGVVPVVAQAEVPRVVYHTVRRGDTLSSIARRYGISSDDLREANNLRGSTIHKGQQLRVPGQGTEPAPAQAREDIVAQLPEQQRSTSPAKASPRIHTVKSGQSLWSVARQYGVSVPDLAAANDLSPSSQLTVGKRLEIPGRGTSSARASTSSEAVRMTYKVRRGDTLSQIADKFNVTVRQLMSWNNMRGSALKAGQRLVLYVPSSRISGG